MDIFNYAYIIYIGTGVVFLILNYLKCTLHMRISLGSDNTKIHEIVFLVNN
jgi:hypothetical protein